MKNAKKMDILTLLLIHKMRSNDLALELRDGDDDRRYISGLMVVLITKGYSREGSV
jgi:hypothetical protein